MNALDVKREVDPGAFYRLELPRMARTRRTDGWVDGGLCPFHPDRRPGSFHVNLDSGAFRCFSCGARGGDIIAFVELRGGLTFRLAVDALARAWGVSP